MPNLSELEAVLESADCIHTDSAIKKALDNLAQKIATDYQDTNPVLICVMNGALYTCVELMSRLSFAMEIDYLQVSRYHGTEGGTIHWLAEPKLSIENRNVLIIDDILDEGYTLKAIIDYCTNKNVQSVNSAVLVRKQHNRGLENKFARYIGLEVPDRYVFGCGMDYNGYFRNLTSIYALGTQ